MTDLAQLKVVLKEHNAEFCPDCRHEIGWGDIAWNEGQSEAGTPESYIQIQCINCQKEIAWIHSWTWFEEEYEKNKTVLQILEEDWEKSEKIK